MTALDIKVEFGGGLELLFDSQKALNVSIPRASDETVITIKDVLAHLKEHHVRERPEMFLQGDTVRPGVLTLVNDTDWELCGGAEYAVQAGDTLTFISTLHGG